jgi:hypothetical protein
MYLHCAGTAHNNCIKVVSLLFDYDGVTWVASLKVSPHAVGFVNTIGAFRVRTFHLLSRSIEIAFLISNNLL